MMRLLIRRLISVGTGAAFQVTDSASVQSHAALYLGGTSAAPAPATYSSTGTSTVSQVAVGSNGVASLTQSAGTLNVHGSLYLGFGPGDSGTHMMSARRRARPA